MEKFLIEKSPFLKGKIEIEGSKNSTLPILCSCLLCSGEIILNRVPFLSDIYIMCELLEELGAKIKKEEQNKRLIINTENIKNREVSYELVKKIRASFLLAGPLLSRFKKAYMQMPGGCAIGVRPVDLHLKGFKALGTEINQEHGIIEIDGTNGLNGAEIHLDFPSVGATENIIMASVFAKGETIISNCATEPEIVDLVEFINKMGGNIEGAGTETIKITGVEKLEGGEHTIIPDRIEAGTFLALGAAVEGEIEVLNVNPEHLRAIISKLKEMNLEIEETENSVKVFGNNKLENTDIKTMPYPGFPTDMQAQFMSLMVCLNGTGVINETVFENRFMHVSELVLMGADIKVEGNSAIIKNTEKLTGTKVTATDLRAGAGLIIAGLCAEGQTEINNIYHIERGYYKIEEKLQKIGAKIKRINE